MEKRKSKSGDKKPPLKKAKKPKFGGRFDEECGSLIFRYPGGKSRRSVREKVLSFFPEHYSCYREPMVGGGGIFFAIPNDKKRWINDKDEHLVSVYRALNERPEEFITKCREIKPPKDGEPLTSAKPRGKPLYNARLKEFFDKCASGEVTDQALRYLFVHRTVWAGRVNYDLESRMYFSNPNGWRIVHTKKMQETADKLKGVIITCGDYQPLLTKPGTGVLVYLDPPYYMNTELDPNSRLYRHNFEFDDHVALRDAVMACDHKIVMSYDDHPKVRELYSDPMFEINSESWTYCGTSSAEGQSKEKQVGKEVIITNKPKYKDW